MTIRSFAALLALLLAVSACGGDGAANESSAKPKFQPPDGPLLGLVWESGSAELAQLDPRTLAPRGRRVDVGSGTLIAFSPDSETIALGHGERPEVEFVDLQTFRPLGSVELGVPGYISRLSWPPPGMLFAAVGQQFVVVIDPVGRTVYETRQVEGTLIGAEPIEAGLLGLVAPADRIGPLELVIWGGKGTVSAPLRGMVGGWETEQGDDESDFRSRELVPGLAVDPGRRRAFVVPPAGPVAEISLRDLSIRYHTLSQPISRLGRFLEWLDPAAEAKLIEGRDRQAVWLGNGLIAVSGTDYPPLEEDQTELHPEPAGLSLIDTSDWSVRKVDEDLTGVWLAGEHLLGYEAGCSGDPESFGLVGYDLRGNEQFRLCRNRGNQGFDPQVVGRYAYLGFEDNTRFEVVDLATGATVARLRTTQSTTILVD